MHLKWSVPEYKEVLIPRLGGIHAAMNFHKCIGQHMQNSGFGEVWVEIGIIGPNVAANIMAGKSYARATRVHEITLQALWHILLRHMYAHLDVHEDKLRRHLHRTTEYDMFDCDRLVDMLSSKTCIDHMTGILHEIQDCYYTAAFWWQYIEMVDILLNYTRAQRDGLWDPISMPFGKCCPITIAAITQIMQGGVQYT